MQYFIFHTLHPGVSCGKQDVPCSLLTQDWWDRPSADSHNGFLHASVENGKAAPRKSNPRRRFALPAGAPGVGAGRQCEVVAATSVASGDQKTHAIHPLSAQPRIWNRMGSVTRTRTSWPAIWAGRKRIRSA